MRRLAAVSATVALLILCFVGQASGMERIKVNAILVSHTTSSYYWAVTDRKSRPIGYYIMHCGARLQGVRECVGTLSMPRGKIALNGSVRFISAFSLMVVGASGTYSDTPAGVFVATKTGFGYWSLGVSLY